MFSSLAAPQEACNNQGKNTTLVVKTQLVETFIFG